MLCSALLCYAMLCYAMLCYAMRCYAMLCDTMLCYAMLCYSIPCVTILYYTIIYYTILYYTVPYYTILHCTNTNTHLAETVPGPENTGSVLVLDSEESFWSGWNALPCVLESGFVESHFRKRCTKQLDGALRQTKTDV